MTGRPTSAEGTSSRTSVSTVILDLAGKRRIAQAITDLRLSIQRYRYFGPSHRFRRNAQEHLAIIAALLDSDEAAAEAAMARHVDQFTEDIRQVLLPGAARRPKP